MKLKRRIAVLALVVLAMAATGVAVAAPASTGGAAPEIAKATFVHYAEPRINPARPPFDDTEDDYKLISGGVRWTSTIAYEVNSAGSGLTTAAVRNALDASSETWDAATAFELFAAPTTTNSTSIGLDGTNRVAWGTLSPGVIAVTTLWYTPRSKQMVEFDMVFNTYYEWSATGEAGKMDLQNIATHELGHNGLSDLYAPKDWALTMFGYSDVGEIYKRTLATGDILGVQRLYGP